MDLYETLGVDKNASKIEIKKGYKKSSVREHPDKPTGSHERFQAVKLAYDVLSDSERKARYDETGEVDSSQSQQCPIESRITQLFTSMINEEKFSGDIIEEAIDIVRTAIGDLVAASCKADTALEKLNKRLGRIKCKDELNMYEIVLSGKISELTDRLSKMDAENEVMQGVLDKLANYSDENPEPEETEWSSHKWPNSL